MPEAGARMCQPEDPAGQVGGETGGGEAEDC